MEGRWDDGGSGTRQSGGARRPVDGCPRFVEKTVHVASLVRLVLVPSQLLYVALLLLAPSQEVLYESHLAACHSSSLLPLVPSLSVLVRARAAVW